MPDLISRKKRSEIMSRILSKNTKLELSFRKKVWNRGFRYRLYYPIQGKPDLVFVSKRLAVFIDSCFWHKCDKHFRRPSSNRKYWDAKMKNNTKHDFEVSRNLKKDGWKVLRLWEHDIATDSEKCIDKLMKIMS